MVTEADIRNYARKLAREFSPERIVLFGSHAQGTATEDSDVDLFVVMAHKGRNVEQALTIRRQIKRSFPLDLIVKTPEEIRSRVKRKDLFVTGILQHGKVLYARA